ncbi:hypothetical protein M433DRAFT_9820 [Acidomyces richmondensis BFW]|nr:hypothetical protein M433DRAFT_9820 [Acidomyces richmondensis BFW]
MSWQRPAPDRQSPKSLVANVVESDGLSVLRPGKSAPKRRDESNGNQDRDED